MNEKRFNANDLVKLADAEPDQNFQVGDYCVLVSGGPVMKVIVRAGEDVYCQYGTIRKVHIFPSVCLRRYSLGRILGSHVDEIAFEGA